MATIIWDIDGVCNNYKKYILKKAVPFFKNKYGKEIVNPNTISIQEMFSVSKEEEKSFWTSHLNLLTYSLFEKNRPGLKETMDKICQNGDKNVICSARAKCDEKNILGSLIRGAVNYWIKRNNLPIDEIYYVSYKDSANEKLKICRNLNPLAVVEDDPENAITISREFPVIKYTDDYNANITGDNIYPIDCYDSLIIAIEQIRKSGKYWGFKFLTREERENLNYDELTKYYNQYRKVMLDMPYNSENRQKQFNRYNKMFKTLLKVHNAVAPKTVLLNPEMIDKIKRLECKGKIFALATHTSLDDIQQVEKVIDEMAFFLVKKEISDYPIIGNFLKSIGCEYVIRQDSESRRYSRSQMEKLVLHDKNIIILPEGTRNRTGNLTGPFEKGVLSISQKTGHTLVPIAMKRTTDKKCAYLKVCEPRIIQVGDNLIEKNKEFEEEMCKEISEIEKIIKTDEINKVYSKLRRC